MEDGGAPGLAEDKTQELLAQVFGLSRPLPLLFYSSVLSLCLASDHILGLPGLSTSFFPRVCTSCFGLIFSGRRQTACGLRLIAWRLKASQQMEFAVAGLEADGLYDLLWGVMTQPDLSASVGLPLPKMHQQAATAMVLGPIAQDYGHRPSHCQAQGRHVRAGGPSPSIPQSKEAAIPTGMESL